MAVTWVSFSFVPHLRSSFCPNWRKIKQWRLKIKPSAWKPWACWSRASPNCKRRSRECRAPTANIEPPRARPRYLHVCISMSQTCVLLPAVVINIHWVLLYYSGTEGAAGCWAGSIQEVPVWRGHCDAKASVYTDANWGNGSTHLHHTSDDTEKCFNNSFFSNVLFWFLYIYIYTYTRRLLKGESWHQGEAGVSFHGDVALPEEEDPEDGEEVHQFMPPWTIAHVRWRFLALPILTVLTCCHTLL